jgi:hypothetical protein
VFENRVMRRMFGPKTNEVTEVFGKLHNGELHDLYSSPSIIAMTKSRMTKWERHVARIGETNAYRMLVGRPERRRPLRRPMSYNSNIWG